MNFSQREGLEPVLKPVLHNSISPTLRTMLWNVLVARLFGKVGVGAEGNVAQEYHMFITLWRHYFKLTMDSYERELASRREWYLDTFEAMEWNEVYDFLEFIAGRMIPYDASVFVADVNQALESENSAFRFVGNKLIRISSSAVAQNASAAAEELFRYSFLEAHQIWNEALQVLGNRDAPDFQKARQLARQALLSLFHSAEKLTQDLNSKVDEKAIAHNKKAYDELLKTAQSQVPPETPLLEQAAEAEGEFVVAQVTAWLRYLIAAAVSLGFLVEIAPPELKPTNPDPWGEKRIREQAR